MNTITGLRQFATFMRDFVRCRRALIRHFGTERLNEIQSDFEQQLVLMDWMAAYDRREVTLEDAILNADLEMADMRNN